MAVVIPDPVPRGGDCKMCFLQNLGFFLFWRPLDPFAFTLLYEYGSLKIKQINISASLSELGLNAFHQQLLIESGFFFGCSVSSFSSRTKQFSWSPGNTSKPELLGKGVGFLTPVLIHLKAWHAAAAHHSSSRWANGQKETSPGGHSADPGGDGWERCEGAHPANAVAGVGAIAVDMLRAGGVWNELCLSTTAGLRKGEKA